MRDRSLTRLRLPAIAASAILVAVPASADGPVSATTAAEPVPPTPTETTPLAAPVADASTSTATTPAPVTTPGAVPSATTPAPAVGPSAPATPSAGGPAAALLQDPEGDGTPAGSPAPRKHGAIRHRRRPAADHGEPAKDTAKAKAKAEAKAKAKADAKAKAKAKADATTAAAPGALDAGALGSLTAVAPVGVPNFFIENFRIPPFLLPIYQAAGIQYGVRWEVLAAINEIETDYGRNLNVSSAGALGWMQFMPSTWAQYGVDANADGKKDPFNPADAIFAAARYLRAAGADKDVTKAIFAYNHADWYVRSVLMRAQLIGGLPADLVGSLTGLTQGRFPVRGTAHYAGEVAADPRKRVRPGHNAAVAVASSTTRRAVDVWSRPGATVQAVQDGKIVALGRSRRLGRFVQLRDVYGNTYTYAHLDAVARHYRLAPKHKTTRAQVTRELDLPRRDPRPTGPATAGTQISRVAPTSRTRRVKLVARNPAELVTSAPSLAARPLGPAPSAATIKLRALRADGNLRVAPPSVRVLRFTPNGKLDLPSAMAWAQESPQLDVSAVKTRPRRAAKPAAKRRVRGRLVKLHRGSVVPAGTTLGRVGAESSPTGAKRGRLSFEIRPAGQQAPRIDPKPILDGWRLLESTAIYRARGANALLGDDAHQASIGQILLMSKEALQKRVLEDPRADIYSCGRSDIRAGAIDRRVLATIEYLSASGLDPTISSLHCGHGTLTSSGNVSEHSTGDAMDIAAVNGVPILGHQGPGTITETTIRRLLSLQGLMKPHQIISLMTFDGTDNTLSLPDHDDHIHVGFRPLYGSAAKRLGSALKPGQWAKLMSRIGKIDNPQVMTVASKYAIRARRGR